MEELTIRQIRNKLSRKSNYAELVVARAKEYGFTINKGAVYDAVSRDSGEHKDLVKKVLISVVKEREQKLAAIV